METVSVMEVAHLGCLNELAKLAPVLTSQPTLNLVDKDHLHLIKAEFFSLYKP